MWSKSWCGWCAVAGMLSLGGGCSTAEGTSEAVALSEFSSRVASLYCGQVAACCQAASVGFDSGTCVQQRKRSVDDYLTHFDGLAVRYDADFAGACLAQLETSKWCGQEVLEDYMECGLAFRGTVDELKPCRQGIECKQAAGRRTTCDDGVCVSEALFDARRGIAGGDCSATCPTLAECGQAPGQYNVCLRSDGLYCSGSAPFGVCRPLAGVGEPCDTLYFWSCLDGSFCDSGSQTCVPLRAAGQPCFDRSECQSRTCTAVEGVCSATALDPASCQ